ncbi:hypothetical protein V5O48_012720 [Marasmius crinis-equi]|uniref:Uncharacterized protein n=1 Tax=Marasmius crinis-equi TaxID=585013 RepID=A0ABR3F293_9AGAR
MQASVNEISLDLLQHILHFVPPEADLSRTDLAILRNYVKSVGCTTQLPVTIPITPISPPGNPPGRVSSLPPSYESLHESPDELRGPREIPNVNECASGHSNRHAYSIGRPYFDPEGEDEIERDEENRGERRDTNDEDEDEDEDEEENGGGAYIPEDDNDGDGDYVPPGGQVGAGAGKPPCPRKGKKKKKTANAKARVNEEDVGDAIDRQQDILFTNASNPSPSPSPESTSSSLSNPTSTSQPSEGANGALLTPPNTPQRPASKRSVNPMNPLADCTNTLPPPPIPDISSSTSLPPATSVPTTPPSVISETTPRKGKETNPLLTTTSAAPNTANSMVSRPPSTPTFSTTPAASPVPKMSKTTSKRYSGGGKAAQNQTRTKPREKKGKAAGQNPKKSNRTKEGQLINWVKYDCIVGCLVEKRTLSVITRLAARCERHEQSWADDIARILSTGSLGLQGALQDSSVGSLYARCVAGDRAEVISQFVTMISQIQFKAAIENYKRTHDLRTTADVFRRLRDSNITESIFLHHAAAGALWASLSAAGTIYLLLLIAANHMRNAMIKEVLTQEIQKVCNALSRPRQNDKLGAIVIDIIIPAITELRRKISFSFSTLFSKQLSKDLSLPECLDSADIKTSDRFFIALQTNTCITTRDYDLWTACLGGVSPMDIDMDEAVRVHLGKRKAEDSPDPERAQKRQKAYQVLMDDVSNFDPLHSLSQLSSDDVHTVHTNFDASLEENQYKMAGKSMKERLEFTNARREEAKGAAIINSLKKGFRENEKDYVVVDPELTDKNIRIVDQYGKTLAFILSRLPEELRAHLLLKLSTVFDGTLRNIDTEREGNPDFEALHLIWYNRFCVRGDGAPENVDPQFLGREGVPRMHFQNAIPHQSKDTVQFQKEWEDLQEVMKPVFEWLGEQVKKYFPEEADHIRMFADLLPNDAYSPIHPFGGIVINFNIASTFHRDPKDEQICLVMCISDCVGGELVLYEPGMVLRLRCGDAVIFRSTQISHFNQHYIGQRASFVMSTDSAGKAWIHDRNGWGTNERKTCIKAPLFGSRLSVCLSVTVCHVKKERIATQATLYNTTTFFFLSEHMAGECTNKYCSCRTFVPTPGTPNTCRECNHPHAVTKKKAKSSTQPPAPTAVPDPSGVQQVIQTRAAQCNLHLTQLKLGLSNKEANQGLAGQASASKAGSSIGGSSKKIRGKKAIGQVVEDLVTLGGLVLNPLGTTERSGVAILNVDTTPNMQSLGLYNGVGLGISRVLFNRNMTPTELDTFVRKSIPVLGAVDIDTGELPVWRACHAGRPPKKGLTYAGVEDNLSGLDFYNKRLAGKRAHSDAILVIATECKLAPEAIYRHSSVEDYVTFQRRYNQFLLDQGVPEEEWLSADEDNSMDTDAVEIPCKRKAAPALKAPEGKRRKSNPESDEIENFSDEESESEGELLSNTGAFHHPFNPPFTQRPTLPSVRKSSRLAATSPTGPTIYVESSEDEDDPPSPQKINFWDTERIKSWKL